MSKLKVIGFLVDEKKYCRDCTEKLYHGQTISFRPLYREVERQSCIPHCEECKKDLGEEINQ
jgi:hypothetical protein